MRPLSEQDRDPGIILFSSCSQAVLSEGGSKWQTESNLLLTNRPNAVVGDRDRKDGIFKLVRSFKKISIE